MANIKELKTIDAESVDMNPDKLRELDVALNFQLGIIKGIAILRKGGIVFEKYFKGYHAENTHHLTSVTQSVTSALVGIAIDKGYIKSVDQPILDFFPEAESKASDMLKRNLTIKHLLTMTAPYSWKKSEPLDRLRRQKNWTMFMLEMLGQKGQLGEFQFNMSNAHLLSAIITRSTGLSTREFANKSLFSHLGVKEIVDQQMKSFSKEEVYGESITGWIKDPQNINTGGWGLSLTLRDMLRLGYLYLNKGQFNDKPIISENWITESLKQHTEDCGYLWWLREDKGINTFLAAGIGGTYLYCVPEKDLIVAIVSKVDKMIIDRWELMADYIIPSITDS
ncbi:serine hydrolase [Gilliamella sp. B3482]|uniref:serine hydrolase domain-containing protein n=1 Tax=Gilliamella sp. B3482 TaxID=2817991 RepID=UPI00226A9DB6|nr:serine hydrolase [Gilliamella sp. B3482]MCX8581600.1 serine hydrolase [Gilliamella sp. B3482]